MRAADYIVDIGPGAGVHGGEVVAAGTRGGHLRMPEQSLTGQYLSGTQKIEVPTEPPQRQRQICSRCQRRAENNLQKR